MTALVGRPGFRLLRDGPARPPGRHRRPRAALRGPGGWRAAGRGASGWPAAVIVVFGLLATSTGLAGRAVTESAGSPPFGPNQVPATQAPSGPAAAPLT